MNIHTRALFTLAAATFYALLMATTAVAASKPVPAAKVFTVTVDNENYSCTTTTKGKILVIKKKGKYITGATALEQLKAELTKKRALKTKSGKKKIAALKAKIAAGNTACSTESSGDGGNGDKGGSGSATLTKLTRPLTRKDVQYLLDKAALGLSSHEEQYVEIGLTQGVEALVNALTQKHDEPAGLLARVEDRLDNVIGSTSTQSPAGQRAALLDLWVNTNNPYQEKFALFMLSVWTVGGDVIEDETFRSAFWDYYQRLREHVYSGDTVPNLGLAIARDPLMLIYLNNELNVKGNPNENFARELMELFTLGPLDLDGNPNYTETALDGSGDISVAAKMLTGWKVKKDYTINKLVPQYEAARHQNGPYTMFPGKPYAFTGENDEDLIRGIFLHHPGAKRYYAAEILKQYVTPKPPRALIEAFGEVIAEKGFHLDQAMKVLLQSEAFYDPAYANTVPLNSFEFAAKSARILELYNGVNYNEAQTQVRKMGMQINYAPSVFWYNQSSWSGSSIALEKANYIALILDDSTSQQAAGWQRSKVLPTGTVTLPQLIAATSERVGVTLNAAQLQSLNGYLTTQLQYNNVYTPFTYDNNNAQHQLTKGLGLYYLMFLSSEFNLL